MTLLFTSLLVSSVLMAQGSAMETDVMRSNGKIYVVMAVVITIVVVLIAYVALLDRKISQLEKKNH